MALKINKIGTALNFFILLMKPRKQICNPRLPLELAFVHKNRDCSGSDNFAK